MGVRVDIKTVKGKDYVQLVDDHGFIHHVGPASVTNLAAALHTKGIYEHGKVNRWLEDYYISKGCVLDDDTEHKVGVIVKSYNEGFQGLSPSGSNLFDKKEVEEICTKLGDRIDVLDMIRGDFVKMFERAGRHLSEAELRKIVQETYRDASEERRRRYKEQFDERFIDRLMSVYEK